MVLRRRDAEKKEKQREEENGIPEMGSLRQKGAEITRKKEGKEGGEFYLCWSRTFLSKL